MEIFDFWPSLVQHCCRMFCPSVFSLLWSVPCARRSWVECPECSCLLSSVPRNQHWLKKLLFLFTFYPFPWHGCPGGSRSALFLLMRGFMRWFCRWGKAAFPWLSISQDPQDSQNCSHLISDTLQMLNSAKTEHKNHPARSFQATWIRVWSLLLCLVLVYLF